MPSNAANLKIVPMDVYYDDVHLGFIEGDIGMSTETTEKEATAHQTGEDPISTVVTGTAVNVTLALKEYTKENLKLAFSTIGGTHTPTGSGATEVFGIGSSKNFQNVYQFAKRLRFHPVSRPESDHSEDWTFWKAYPRMEEINFSGSEFVSIPLTFRIFEDPSKPAGVNKLCIGDSTQSEFDDEV